MVAGQLPSLTALACHQTKAECHFSKIEPLCGLETSVEASWETCLETSQETSWEASVETSAETSMETSWEPTMESSVDTFGMNFAMLQSAATLIQQWTGDRASNLAVTFPGTSPRTFPQTFPRTSLGTSPDLSPGTFPRTSPRTFPNRHDALRRRSGSVTALEDWALFIHIWTTCKLVLTERLLATVATRE